ncbi:hypothetical protein [Hydrogenophaga luteola]|uniref:DUF2147 domain-containing protein n=1 Tax=Hydrogenophaga luteola TaxID=1591122 RepID=A0ABV7W835_9BURK
MQAEPASRVGFIQALDVMEKLLALLAFMAASNCAFSQVPDCLIGRWKSDEALTLADMRKHPEVTEKAKALFENKFFGRLILIFGSRHVGSYFEDEQTPADLLFDEVRIVESGSNWATLRSRLLGVEYLQHWGCENGRIYAVITKWEFREYFSPLP